MKLSVSTEVCSYSKLLDLMLLDTHTYSLSSLFISVFHIQTYRCISVDHLSSRYNKVMGVQYLLLMCGLKPGSIRFWAFEMMFRNNSKVCSCISPFVYHEVKSTVVSFSSTLVSFRSYTDCGTQINLFILLIPDDPITPDVCLQRPWFLVALLKSGNCLVEHCIWGLLAVTVKVQQLVILCKLLVRISWWCSCLKRKNEEKSRVCFNKWLISWKNNFPLISKCRTNIPFSGLLCKGQDGGVVTACLTTAITHSYMHECT